jgi:hypothetical protein|tara:strand:+ start:600 stop:809 length:210 start_codon:yes stop_codon:yes gene_type:complete
LLVAVEVDHKNYQQVLQIQLVAVEKEQELLEDLLVVKMELLILEVELEALVVEALEDQCQVILVDLELY